MDVATATTASSVEVPLEARQRELELTILMPCLNEGETIGTCIRKAFTFLRRVSVEGEVLIADNGSTDNSIEIARLAGARVVSVGQKGYGAALMGGIEAARGRFIIMGDADDSYDFAKLDQFLDKLRAGFDVVVGNRFVGGIERGAMPWLHRYLGNPVLSFFGRHFFSLPIGDFHCGLRGFTKEHFQKLHQICTGMEFASEMIVNSSAIRARVAEVPITLYLDGQKGRPPHLRTFRDGWRHLRFLLLLCPFWLYLVPGYLFMGIGLALMTWFGLQPRPQEVFLYSFLELLGSGCVLAGYEVLWLGAFAKAFGSDTGLFPPTRTSGRFLRWLWLERGLVVGLLLFSAGLGFDLWLGWQLSGASIGSLDLYTSLRGALWGCTIMLLGLQTIFGSFFLTMLSMRSSSESHGS